MINMSSFQHRQGMLRRPRIHALLQDGLQHPVLTIFAGPGYGKTQAVADFLPQHGVKFLWVRLSILDNMPSHFWNHLISTFSQAFPGNSSKLREIEFPGSPFAFEVFFRLWQREMEKIGEVIWAFDDFGEVTDPQVQNFFAYLAEVDLPGFHLLFLTNSLANMNPHLFTGNRSFLITTEELRFSSVEVAELYLMHSTKLSERELSILLRYTEGWPLALHLLVLQYKHAISTEMHEGAVKHYAIIHMFEKRFFSAYSKEMKKLVVKLSLLNSFTTKFAAELYDGDPEELERHRNHAFFINEPSSGRYYLHNMYRTFLQEKLYLLDKEEEQIFWRQSAAYYEEVGEAMEAISCYRKCGEHIRILHIIADKTMAQFGMEEVTARYFLELLDLLTPEQVHEYPIANVIRALIYTITMNLEKAEEMVMYLEEKLARQSSPNYVKMLGEVYIVHGFARMLQAKEDFGKYFEKAAHCLPNGSIYKTPRGLRVHNNHSFFLPDTGPLAKERVIAAVHYGVPWMAKVLQNGMGGMQHIFSAEASLLSYELKEAQQHAYRGIFEAESYAQHDLVLNGHFLLLRIAYMRGDFSEMTQHFETINAYADKYQLAVLDEIRDTVSAWYYIMIGDYKRVSKTISGLRHADQSLMSQGRALLVHAIYLVHTEEYPKLVGFLEQQRIYSMQTNVVGVDYIYARLLLAIGYLNTGNTATAMDELYRTYQLTYHNGLICPYVEAYRYMPALLSEAAQQETYTFDPEWLAEIQRLVRNFAKRASDVRSHYRKQGGNESFDNPLTKRETDVLHALAKGLTREEISQNLYISVNTVKSVLRSIYNKLDANNRADAVALAIARGYIPGYDIGK